MGRRVEPGKGRSGGYRLPETTTDLVLKLPAPPARPIADTPVLITEEQEVFARCEVAIENLKVAFWAAGKALQIIRDGRLYRGSEYTSFDAYCWERWGMTRGQADKLIRMWPIAEALFESMPTDSNEPTRIRVKKLNQSVVWELVPVAEGYDVETATTVYRSTLEAGGDGAVTAEVVKNVVQELPKGREFDGEALTRAARAAWERVAARRKTKKTTTAKRTPVPAAPAPALPWGSPEGLNGLLRQHMSPEDRRTLGKLLLED